MLDPRLLEILCCPADLEDGTPCHGDLEPRVDGLRCRNCGLLYPIVDGIPVMLQEEATRVEA